MVPSQLAIGENTNKHNDLFRLENGAFLRVMLR